ncbi:SpoIIE family protein phosphatase [Desulfobaculum bizertense]|uniref:SpoIIE family protein phosphatase n=1 Tax=Desulfobaculum bizertense TaxID=376490 RepID=UPI001F2E2E4B|nr:SpoIIE family protein phosphatase [Desulfobaculum bizertense]UIJ39281.1 SpoIIE family protein phosphatase [Desulfobaculum bizertense]
MSFRWKLFLTSLLVALLPLTIVAILSNSILLRGGDKLALSIGSNLERLIGEELSQTAAIHVRDMYRAHDSLSFILQDLNRDVEEALTEPESKDKFRIFSAQDFDNADTAPPDLSSFPNYYRSTMMGQRIPVKVSFAFPSIYYPGRVKSPDRLRDAQKLYTLTPALRHILEGTNGAVFRVHITLRNGLHLAYPGHGAYPSHFDGRSRPYYKTAQKNDGTFWTEPHIDITTQRVIYTICMPTKDSNGTFQGVVALDILLPNILKDDGITDRWSSQAQVFMVLLREKENGGTGLRIYAQRQGQSQAMHHWRSSLQAKWLESSDPGGQEQLLREMKTVKKSYITLPYRGRPSLWAFARARSSTHFHMIIVPLSVTETIPNKARKIILDTTRQQSTAIIIAVAVTLFILILFTTIGTRILTKPIEKIADVASRINEGDFDARINFRLNDERDRLIDVLNESGPKLREQVQQKQALELAQEVQQRLLPSAPPEIPGWELSGLSTSCDETGGDYFDYFYPCPDSPKASIVIGDVTGHGLAPALIMATIRAELRALSAQNHSPAELMEQVNALISSDLAGTGNFITMFYIELDHTSNELEWVKAGHDPAIVYSPASDSFSELDGEGLPLGITTNFPYGSQKSQVLEPGTVILLSTDGIWEAHNAQNEMFGKDRLRDVLRSNASLSSLSIKRRILDAIDEFTDGHPLDDDVTLIVMKFMGQDAQNTEGESA